MITENILNSKRDIGIELSQYSFDTARIEYHLSSIKTDLSDNSKASPYFHNRPKILLVEDNFLAQLVGSQMLAEAKFNVDIAKDYRQGWRLYKANAYDLILLDVELPGKSGLELCSKIRERERGQIHCMPIIAQTACGESARADCFAAGVDDFIEKPLLQETLLQIIDKWIQ